MEKDNFIKVWQFHEAPQELRDLSPHGGDEDYLMLVPAGWEGFWPEAWRLEGTSFGCSDVSEHELPDGSIVLIGAHA